MPTKQSRWRADHSGCQTTITRLRTRAVEAETAADRLRQALADIQFDLINCHQAAGRSACEHIQDAIKIVNRTLKE